MKKLNHDSLAQFLGDEAVPPLRYPHVARLIARWIESGDWEDVDGLAQTCWNRVQYPHAAAR